jgi:hypothetical protein
VCLSFDRGHFGSSLATEIRNPMTDQMSAPSANLLAEWNACQQDLSGIAAAGLLVGGMRKHRSEMLKRGRAFRMLAELLNHSMWPFNVIKFMFKPFANRLKLYIYFISTRFSHKRVEKHRAVKDLVFNHFYQYLLPSSKSSKLCIFVVHFRSF